MTLETERTGADLNESVSSVALRERRENGTFSQIVKSRKVACLCMKPSFN
jgi:hypothetical protein